MDHKLPIEELIKLLPDSLKQPIYVVADDVKSPLSIILTSKLAAISSAVQGYVNVRTTFGTVQPVSLYTLVIADSGERKSSTDKCISKPLLELERTKLSSRDQTKQQNESSRVVLQEKRKSCMKKLRKAIELEDTEQISVYEAELSTLADELKALDVKTDRTILNDVTPAALYECLHGVGKSVTLSSSEAGGVFTHTNIKFISHLNTIWDGDSFHISRKSGDMQIDDPRLTLSLMIQPEIFNKISERKRDIFRYSDLTPV